MRYHAHNFLVRHKIPLINIWQLVTNFKTFTRGSRSTRRHWHPAVGSRGGHSGFLWGREESCSLSQNLIYGMRPDERSRLSIRHYKKQTNQCIIFREADFNSPISFTIPTFAGFHLLCLTYLLGGRGVFFLGSYGLPLSKCLLRKMKSGAWSLGNLNAVSKRRKCRCRYLKTYRNTHLRSVY